MKNLNAHGDYVHPPKIYFTYIWIQPHMNKLGQYLSCSIYLLNNTIINWLYVQYIENNRQHHAFAIRCLK